jgi:hypothetical protein
LRLADGEVGAGPAASSNEATRERETAAGALGEEAVEGAEGLAAAGAVASESAATFVGEVDVTCVAENSRYPSLEGARTMASATRATTAHRAIISFLGDI